MSGAATLPTDRLRVLGLRWLMYVITPDRAMYVIMVYSTVRDEERIAAALDRDSVATLGPTAFGWSRAAS